MSDEDDALYYLQCQFEDIEMISWAEMAASIGGPAEEAFERLSELNEMATTILKRPESRRGSQPDNYQLLKITLAIKDENLSVIQLIEKALDLWYLAVGLQRQQLAVRSTTRDILAGINWLDRSKRPIIPSSVVAETIAKMDFSQVKRLDDWLKLILPSRNTKADRLERLRKYLACMIEPKRVPRRNRVGFPEVAPPPEHDLVDLVDSRMQKLKELFANNQDETRQRQEAACFMAWDRAQAIADRKTKAKNAAEARWGSKDLDE
jgi:hypothetical protein